MKKNSLVFVFVILLSFSWGIMATNNSLQFDGTNDYVEINSLTTPLSSASSFTIECWFYGDDISSLTGNQILWGINGPVENPNSNVIMFAVHGNVFKVYDGNSGSGYTSTTTTLQPNNWYHVAFVKFSDDSFIVYLNGNQELTGNQITDIPSGNTFSIGQEWDSSPSDFFEGKIDEFRVWNDVRSEAEIRQNMYRELPNSSDESLIGYFQMNSNLDDNTSNDNDGTFQGGTASYSTSSAMFGPKNCLDLDGLDDYINCGSLVNPSSLSTLTIESWVNLDYIGNDFYNRIFSQKYIDDTNTGIGWLNMNSNGTLYTYLSGSIQSGSISVNQNEWSHIALVWDGSHLFFYINGIQDPNVYSLSSLADCDNELLIGWQGHYENTFFNGKMDEIRIWSDARTASEIRENMCKTITGNESGLLAYYNFDNTSGDILQDLSGNANDGTLTNMEAADWVSSSAFNTWLNTSSSIWSTPSNWSNGVPSSGANVGIYNFENEPDIPASQTFNTLYLGSGITTSLTEDMIVNGSLILDKDLDLNGKTISLGSSATLVENSGYLYGNSGTITTTRDLSDIDENIAGLGVVITEDGDLGSTTITRGHTAQGSQGIERFYQITPISNPSSATLVFHYNDSELNGHNESTLKLFKSTDGSSWTEQGSSTVNTSDNTITQTGINEFSYWTAAPTGSDSALPVTLSLFTAGYINSASTLSWRTQSELSNAGWNIYRSNIEDIAAASLQNPDLISGAGTSSVQTDYTFIDPYPVLEGNDYWYWLESISYTGEVEIFGPVQLSIPNSEQDENSPIIPETYGLHQNYPNPFNPNTQISFYLQEAGDCQLNIYNVKGQLVKSLFDGKIDNEKTYIFNWDGTNNHGLQVDSGIFFYSLRTPTYTQIEKMLLIK